MVSGQVCHSIVAATQSVWAKTDCVANSQPALLISGLCLNFDQTSADSRWSTLGLTRCDVPLTTKISTISTCFVAFGTRGYRPDYFKTLKARRRLH